MSGTEVDDARDALTSFLVRSGSSWSMVDYLERLEALEAAIWTHARQQGAEEVMQRVAHMSPEEARERIALFDLIPELAP